MRGKTTTTTTTRVRSAPKRRQQRRRNREVVTTTTTRRTSRRNRGRFRYRPTPAAFSSRFSSDWSVRQRGACTYVTGHDILSFPSTRAANENGIFWSFPANPVYWTGTQIAALASSFMNFRPLRLTVAYKPKVGTSESGSVNFGTSFDKVVTSEALVRMLNASNGGFTTQVYSPARTTIHLGTNLQQNMFTTCGSIEDVDSNPFTMIAHTDCSRAGAPGEFTVYYTYKLANPGIKAVYDNTGLVTKIIAKGLGETVSDYTIEQPSSAVSSFTTFKDMIVDGVKYGAGTVFGLGKHALTFDQSVIPFKAIYNALTNHDLFGVLYSYISGGQ